MAIGRITGPLLAENLFRDNKPLAFYNSSPLEKPTLYFDATNQRIGIKTNTPQFDLDVDGTLKTKILKVEGTATIGQAVIEYQETSATTLISTLLGSLTIQPAALEKIFLNAETKVDGIFTATDNIYTAGDFTATGNLSVGGNIHAKGNITAEGNIVLGDTTGTDTLVVDAEIKSDLTPFIEGTEKVSTVSLGSKDALWKDVFAHRGNFDKIDAGTGTDITVFPNPILNSDGFPTNLLSINGDIRVYGANPIGTAPVVTNVLYVTEDGDDTNDGRAEDSSRACRTITGAVNSPFYKEGTIIKVRSGIYRENNPILLKPYTCVIGDDLRTTFVEPINKTLDLFHVNSGVYIAQMKFLNLRRGEVTRYAPGGAGTYTTGAYCVAFPPSLDNPIDLFYSPYIQNCTNQSGPWLMDGTMFVPNQTVQAPTVVGYATYDSNATSLLVTVATGTVDMISIGDIVNGNGIVTDPRRTVPVVTDIRNPDTRYDNARRLLEANRTFIQAETIGYVNSIKTPGFTYNTATCYRDVGLIVDAITHDAVLGGNKESIKAGSSYYNGNTILIPGEVSTTTAAIKFIGTLSQYIVSNSIPPNRYQTTINQTTNFDWAGGNIIYSEIGNCIDNITSFIEVGRDIENASSLITANRSFIQEEVIAYINITYSNFNYDREICYRDVGLIIDAVQDDLLHLSNISSVKAGRAYWNGATSRISGEITQTIAAINHIKLIISQIIRNQNVTSYQSLVSQVINTNFNISSPNVATSLSDVNDENLTNIATIIQNGPLAPLSTQNVNAISPFTQFRVELSVPTSTAQTNDKLYFGQGSTFPLLDDELPIEWTTSTYADRRIDPHGSGGGALVDGNAPSLRSPIQSFVFDAFTQVNQGGNGIRVINNGYAQLVSVFTIFCDVAVHCESGGICSITNSNSNFGDLCLVSEGYGKREFGGTVVNPATENYPLGYYPNNQLVEIFVPDPKNRPHIGLVMEVVPPDTYINYEGDEVPYTNAAGFSGFLSANPSVDVLTTGSYTISPIDTTELSIGHTIYVRDQYGSEVDSLGNRYITTGTTITKIEYQTITLSNPIAQGGGEAGNPTYFSIYACGNAYYTILSSTVAEDITPNGQSKIAGQEDETVAAINHLKTLAQSVVTNTPVTSLQFNTAQTINLSYTGAGTQSFIGAELDIINTIISSGPNNAPAVKTSGTVATNAEGAAKLLSLNRTFLQDEVIAYVNQTYTSLVYNQRKCRRDVGLLVDALIADLATGGNFRAVEAGSTYYSRSGTYHLVKLEDNVRDPLLFVDGISVNFYQRSYMSASGYLFEYVGSGIQYGALPQVGKADPIQSKEVVQLNNGKVFFTSTDQNGDFRIGPGLVISQATGVLSGRTFEKSLFAQMTPFILAVETGGGE